jgi:murein DD-endopeptidase MepM/ murein hydrolase activator NlpD
VVKCDNALIKLGQLQNSSPRAQVGARVRRGQAIAKIGNSGDSAEPHLHIGVFARDTPLEHASGASGDAPVTFAGHVLVANTVFTIE